MLDFKETKKELIAKCKSAKACIPEFKKLKQAENNSELLITLAENLQWCVLNGFTKQDFYSWFDKKLLSETMTTFKVYKQGNPIRTDWTGSVAEALEILGI